jgi:hypothetical protein
MSDQPWGDQSMPVATLKNCKHRQFDQQWPPFSRIGGIEVVHMATDKTQAAQPSTDMSGDMSTTYSSFTSSVPPVLRLRRENSEQN